MGKEGLLDRGGEGTILGGRANKHPRLVHPLKGVVGYMYICLRELDT